MLKLKVDELLKINELIKHSFGATLTIYNEEKIKIFEAQQYGCPCLGYALKNIKNKKIKNEFAKNCPNIDETSIEKCKKTLSPAIITCANGITKVYFPLRENNYIFGYVKLSRYVLKRDDDKYEQLIKSTSKKYALDYESYRNIFNSIPTVNESTLSNIVRLVEICIENLLFKEILSKSHTSLTYMINSYISQNLDGDLSTRFLCEKFHISKTTLSNISLKSFGTSIMQHIEKLRIIRAKELLAETEYTVSEIAYNCGFIDGNYLSKRFKQITGLSPSEFRKSNRL